jgi:hypothetical protein
MDTGNPPPRLGIFAWLPFVAMLLLGWIVGFSMGQAAEGGAVDWVSVVPGVIATILIVVLTRAEYRKLRAASA